MLIHIRTPEGTTKKQRKKIEKQYKKCVKNGEPFVTEFDVRIEVVHES